MSTLTHGMRNTPTYLSWIQMKCRCYQPSNASFKRYGAKGITVCDEWKNSFQSFWDDMGTRPEGKSLDRIDNSKGYFKENCRWATQRQQTENRNSSVWITFNGETLLFIDWARRLNICDKSLRWRIKNWGLDRALTVEKTHA